MISSLPNLESIALRSDFFLNHDASQIPSHLLKELDSFEGTEVTNGVFVLLNRTTELFEEIHEYAWYLSDDFPRFFIPRIEKKLREGVSFCVVYPKDFVEGLVVEIPENILNSIDIRILDEVRIVINVSDRFGMLALPGHDGKIDRDNVLLGNEAKFIAWCRSVFEYYLKISRRY